MCIYVHIDVFVMYYCRCNITNAIAMKHTSKRLKSLIAEVQNKIEQREKHFEDRSEKWQDSEAGEKYLERTECLEDVHGLLEEANEGLDEFRNDENWKP